ncbi:putative bifunctional diguanylate cyclase/phosphodiesterase [Uliginosibacterium paludis]|uniref:putative bifunctional diguanylate cyclase/phosphodiesterase n=1 Tax=Uliginosibacterium paludis TaxID=1615952 RepID=UPI0031F696C5
MHLLIVDDDDVDRERVRRMLLSSDPTMHVAEASGPADTMDLLRRQPFDCMIVDYRLGHLTGLELLDQVRAVVPRFCATIMVTGLGDEEIAGAAVRAGISDYLTKGQLDNGRLMQSVTGAMHRAALEKRLHDMAYYDALTTLASRTLLVDRLQQVINRYTRESLVSALAYIDLDNFKPINDTWGHAAGDKVLIRVAERLTHALRVTDTAARLGGDEFALLLTDMHDLVSCEIMLGRISRILCEPITLEVDAGSVSVSVTASIGVALIQDSQTTADTVIRHADHMMYKVKNSGRKGILFFDPQAESSLLSIHHQLDEVSRALERDEFELYYQPQINLLSGDVIGVEALIRWHHPERGLLAPESFWQALHSEKFSRVLGKWVIEQALDRIEAWRVEGLRLTVGVNISVHHLLHPDFCADLRTALQSHPHIPPACLDLEILETAAIDDMNRAVDTLRECKALGLTIALDDFGTGYSSLTHLKRLPADRLKIDKSFVINMLTDPDDQAIVVAVTSLAQAFQRKVIAEGVESAEHIRRLVDIGCLLGQGYGIARPMPAGEILAWIEQRRHNPPI